MRKLFKDTTGATAIEYGIIAAMIALAAVGALTFLAAGSFPQREACGLID